MGQTTAVTQRLAGLGEQNEIHFKEKMINQGHDIVVDHGGRMFLPR